MSYRVGIDFGTTFTAAAVRRDGEQAVELVPLGENGTATASVVFVAPDGSLVVGDAAVRRAVTDPERVVREVKRRIGDPTPVLVAGEPVDAHTLAARFVRTVLDRVSEREGGPPAGIAVTHPASWGPHKRTLFAGALAGEGIADVELVTEPEAAAVAYAATQHVEPGAAIGVYDLGGGTFDAAVLRQLEGGGFELAGRPEGIDSLGGIDFDEAVFELVRTGLGVDWLRLDFDDPLVTTAAAALRRECTEAKKALSTDTEVTIPVMLPGLSTRVRMVRAEFEQLIAPAIDATVDAMRRATASAGLKPADLSAVLLVGGSSRIPLVAQRVSAELDLPVTVDSDPKAVVVTGAVLALGTAPGADRTASVLAAAPVRSRRMLTVAIGLAACATALVVLAGTVGTDIMPTGGGAEELAAAPAPGAQIELDAEGIATPQEAVDPWTGEPYTETTAPGPTRENAEPAAATPAALRPTPTTGNNRDALVAGQPSKPNPPGTVPGGGTSAEPPAEEPPAEEPPAEEPPAEEPPVEEPPAEEPPAEEPPAEEPPAEEPPPVDPPVEDPPPAEDPPAEDPPPADPPAGESALDTTQST